MQVSLEEGPTIIYVPTRKETLRIADYLCKFNVKAAAYHAKVLVDCSHQKKDLCHASCLSTIHFYAMIECEYVFIFQRTNIPSTKPIFQSSN